MGAGGAIRWGRHFDGGGTPSLNKNGMRKSNSLRWNNSDRRFSWVGAAVGRLFASSRNAVTVDVWAGGGLD
jgi:hypothetical protein